MHLRHHAPSTRIAAGFGVSLGTAHADVTAGPARRTVPGSALTLRGQHPESVLLDITLAECDHAGDSRADLLGQAPSGAA
ncbi:hypothetical protein GCM10010308_71180 [Streptomyces vinaceusdrappus]|nr:hypothetical protein GCM10010308_71180 [Streptomyces vinaceusdrappus]